MKKIRFYQTFGEMIGVYLPWVDFRAYLSSKVKMYNNAIPIDDKFQNVYRLLLNRHWADYTLYRDYYFEDTVDPSFTPDFTHEDYPDSWFREFYEVYLSTYEKYIALLDFYASQKAHLLDKIGSISKNKYNDTPQNGGDFDNDNHLSTINTTTVEQDVSPLINRLDDISKLYQNVLSDWADEFKHLFIPQGVNDYE